MKKWILIILLLAIGGGGVFLYLRIRKAREDAKPYEMEEMTDAGVAEGLLSPELKKRLDAVAQLSKLPVEKRRAALLAALRAAYAPARLSALTALSPEFGKDGEVVTAVLSVVRDDLDPDVREAAFGLLTGSGDSRVLSVAAEVLLSTEAPLTVKLKAARTLDTLTGRETAKSFAAQVELAEETADDLGFEWDDWIGENAGKLKWNEKAGRFE